MVLPKGARALTLQPSGACLIGADQSITADREHDRPQTIEGFFNTIWFGGNLEVEAEQGIVDKGFNEDFLGLSGAVLGQVVPANAKTTAFHFASPPLLAGAL
jgi:hypothetical protein